MASTYTLNNGIELIGTGEQSGTWGDTTNTNLELLDTALDGQVTVTLPSAGTSGSPNTLAISDGAASDGRNRMVIFNDGGDLGATAYVQLTPNDAEKIIYVRNDLAGSRSIILFQGTYNASNDYEVPAGTTAVIYFDGAGSGAVAANVFNNAHFDAMNIVGNVEIGGTLSVTGETTVSADVNFGDDDKAIFGAGSDLQIYHDGTSNDSIIAESGSGNLELRGTNIKIGSATGSVQFIETSSASLWTRLKYNSDVKLSTTNTGVDITGSATISTDLTVDTDTLYVDSTNDKVVIGGTSSSGTSLGVFNGSDSNTIVRIDGADQTTEFLAFGVGNGYASLTAGNTSGSGFNTSMTFYTAINGSETHRMTLDENGWLGIGQTNPGRLLDLVATNNHSNIRLTDNTSTATSKDGIITNVPYNTAQDDFLVLNARAESTINRIQIGGQSLHTAGVINGEGVQGATQIDFFTYPAVNTESYNGDGVGPRFRIMSDGGLRSLPSNGANVFFNDANSTADFTVKGSTDNYLLRVDAGADKVGIGLSTPSEKLDVEGSIRSVDTTNGGKLIARGLDATLHLDITGANNAKIFYDTNDLNIISGSPSSVGNVEMQVQADGDIILGRTAGKRLFLDASSGYVGIGTENPQNALHVAQDGGGTQPVPFGSEPQIIIGGNHSGGGNQGYHGSLWFAAGDSLTDFNKSAGIVSYSATDVSSTSAEADLRFYTTNNGTTSPTLRAYIFDSGQFQITGSGSVLSGFGSGDLLVNKGANSTPSTSGTGATGSLVLRGGDNAIIDMGVNGGTYTWLQAYNNVDTTNEYTFAINPNGGNVGIGLNNPSTSLHVRKGSAVSYYKDLYASAIIEYDESRLQIAATDGGSDSACLILSAGANNWIAHARGPDQSNAFHLGYYQATADSNIGGNLDVALAITKEGHVTHPDQPRGRMRKSTSTTGQVIDGSVANVKVTMGSSSQTNGGVSFSATNSRMTVSATGTYLISTMASGSVDTPEVGDGIQFVPRINGSDVLGTYEVPITSTGDTAGEEFQATTTYVLPLNDGDYVELHVFNIGANSDFNINTAFVHICMIA